MSSKCWYLCNKHSKQGKLVLLQTPQQFLEATVLGSRWDISVKEATPEAVSRAVALAAGAQKAKYGALQAGWMPATPDEQVCRAPWHSLR